MRFAGSGLRFPFGAAVMAFLWMLVGGRLYAYCAAMA
jgi:hypothetical protein